MITATAALESGAWALEQQPTTTPASSAIRRGSEHARLLPAQLRRRRQRYGVVDLEQAIQVSDDDFFYNLGYELNAHPLETWTHPNGGALQKWAHEFGIGQPTGRRPPR